MKTFILPLILSLYCISHGFGQIVQLEDNLRGGAYTIPEFMLLLDGGTGAPRRTVSLKAFTSITCRAFRILNNPTIRLFGDVTINCDHLELDPNSTGNVLNLILPPGLAKANFTIWYKTSNNNVDYRIIAVDGINVSFIRQ